MPQVLSVTGSFVALRLRRALVLIIMIGARAVFAAEAGSTPSVVTQLNPSEARTRIESLRAEIAHHDELYYKKSAPEISDAAYDKLKRELSALEQTFSALAKGASPSDSLGDDRSGAFSLYRHRERMLSLDKSYSEAELRTFHARVAQQLGRNDLVYIVEPKFDGLAISVTYEKGKLVRAVTRGNGIEGDDVTANALTISTLPRELRRAGSSVNTSAPIPDVIELRGEVYLPFAEFDRINREREAAGEAPFAHPRNLAAGTLKQLDPREVAERKLAIVFYGWGACEPSSARPASQRELHERIRAWGLPGVERTTVTHSADETWAAVQAFDRERAKLVFPVDGAVVKLDSTADWKKLGATEHAPRWAIAYKFSAERAETKLLAITVQVGRTGVLTPVAELAPVRLSGSSIARASLHNRDEIARGDIRVGDFVYVEKAGEIIPAIVGVNASRRGAGSQPFIFPMKCPSCQTSVIDEIGEAVVRCPNPDCPAQLQRRLQHFASEACVGIEGLGPATINTLVKSGRVKTIADLYRLRREDLVPGASSSGKIADRLLAAIAKSRSADLWRFIYGLGIPRVGVVSAKDLAREFGSLEALVAAGPERLSVAKLSPSTAAAVLAYIAEPKNRALVADLLAAGVKPSNPVAPSARSGVFTGKNFVLTGTLATLTRAQANDKIIAAGGRVAESVSQKTDFVLVGEGSGAKLKAASDLGIATIDEAEFLRLLAKD
jgi:DNA ligase (NAD+)